MQTFAEWVGDVSARAIEPHEARRKAKELAAKNSNAKPGSLAWAEKEYSKALSAPGKFIDSEWPAEEIKDGKIVLGSGKRLGPADIKNVSK